MRLNLLRQVAVFFWMRYLGLLLCLSMNALGSCDILLLGDSWVNGRVRLAKPLAQYSEVNGGLVGGWLLWSG